MRIIVHQAICGEQNKAWELLKTTLDDNSLARKIAFQADLQDSPPSGQHWSPVVRGFTFGDFFLFIKTYPDNSSDVRNGRVFSHCLILNKVDLSQVYDISILLNIFPSEINKSIHLEPIIVTSEQQEFVTLGDSVRLRFNKAIQSFLTFTSGAGPIVWVGYSQFEIAVCKMWQMLSPRQREDFYFGINFNPNEVVKDKLAFIVIPENSETKFLNKGFTIIRKEDSVQLTEFVDQFLAGENSAITRINNFVSAVEASQPSPKDISVIAKGVPTFENLDQVTDLKLLNTLANIIAKYSPEDSRGTQIKTKLVERISLLIEKSNKSEILLLRNFQTKSFRGSEKKISSSISKWCHNFLFNEKQNQVIDYASFIVQVSEAPQENWVIQLISQNLTNFLSNVSDATARVIWKWISNDASVINLIGSRIDTTKVAEKNLCDSFVELDKFAFESFSPFILKRKWFKLYALILKLQNQFPTSIELLLKVNTDPSNFDGIEILTDGIKPRDIVAFTVNSGDRRFFQISGKLCHQAPSLLSDLQVGIVNWQEIWLASISNGNKVDDGIASPQAVIYSLFDLLINGHPVNGGLIHKISETSYANLLTYGSRNRIWAKLPEKSRRNFLEKTSANLLEALSKNSTYQVPSDTELSNYIVSNAISGFLYYNRSSIKSVLPIFNTYSQIPESVVRDYVSNYSVGIDVVDSVQLGKLIQARNFSKVANVVKGKVKDIKNFKHALAECHSLLGFLDRGLLLLSGTIDDLTISKDEWWAAFSNISFKLYQGGPSENQIWKQAGGHNYDLNLNVSGKESWLKALNKLRSGSCKDITTKKLLKAMIEEYPKNQELKTLKELWSKI